MDDGESLDWLDDPARFAIRLGMLDNLDGIDQHLLLEQLERHLTSSSWVTARLFKPGIRNLFLQERLGSTAMLKKLELFLGDQEYHFKFFFQDATRRGKVPGVLELLRQAINVPRFRFRLEAIDMLVELDSARVVPVLFNLLSGMPPGDEHGAAIHDRVDANLDALAELVEKEPGFDDAFRRLRLLLASRDTGV